MPAWSDEIADAFLVLASSEHSGLDQLQLQRLVYVAHGWRLAISGEPLTGDRPELTKTGLAYSRISARFKSFGTRRIFRPTRSTDEIASILNNKEENEVIEGVYRSYGRLSSAQLLPVTRDKDGPWAMLRRQGHDEGTEISHASIRAQFVQLARSIKREE